MFLLPGYAIDGYGRAIVVVTDGADVSSTSSLSDAITAAQHAHAAVYAIGIAGPDFTASALKRLASETGGSYRQASSSRQLAQTYASLRDELSRTWQLSYLTSARPGGRLGLTATARGGVARMLVVTLCGQAGRWNPVIHQGANSRGRHHQAPYNPPC